MYLEIESLYQLEDHIYEQKQLIGVAIQGLDLRTKTADLLKCTIQSSFFLGCQFAPEVLAHIQKNNNFIVPFIPNLPYNPFRPKLYEPLELLKGYVRGDHDSFSEKSVDSAIYKVFKQSKPADVISSMTQRLHDHAIDDALEAILDLGDRKLKVVGIMGGHSMKRNDENYAKIAHLGYRLTKKGFFVATGGGPGAMEAGNLGAYLSRYEEKAVDDAIAMMKEAPTFRDKGWFDTALDVREKYPSFVPSLGVPTWFYGHEPSNLFASHHAKYFANSIREDGLLRICYGGVIYAPGKAGTVQEIFQDACQNHYKTCKYVSAMVLLDKEYWTNVKPVMPLLASLSKDRLYEKMITAVDDIDEAIRYLSENPPI